MAGPCGLAVGFYSKCDGKPQSSLTLGRHDLTYEHQSVQLLYYMENESGGVGAGRQAIEQLEMLVASNGQKQLPFGSGQRWRRLGEEETKSEEGVAKDT